MAKYTLISFKLCPFVQRAVIALQEKGVEYDIEYIDLANKPQWFLDISPFGKVPVLKVDDTVLFESAVIAEYLDESAPGRKLHPQDALRRAHNRAWIEFSSSLLVDQFRLTMAKDPKSAGEHAEKLREGLARVEKQLGDGPFFNGAEFSLVDAATAPLLMRNRWIDDIRPELELGRGLPKVTAWQNALLDRASVQRSTVTDIVDLFHEYVRRPRGEPPTTGWLGLKAS